MEEDSKRKVIARYNKRFKEFGVDIRTLASGSPEHQRLRFSLLTEIMKSEGCSILDLGCGFGDLYGFLNERGIKVDYIGYDINPKLIERARKKYPAGRFECKDIQKGDFPVFDYILSTSSFNNRYENNYEFVADIIRRCFRHALKGVAIDFLTSYVDYSSSEAFYYEPERVFNICKQITKRVCLRHDYPLFEFMVYLYPDFKGWGKESH